MNIQPGFQPPLEPALFLGRLSSALHKMESDSRKYDYQFFNLINNCAVESFSTLDEKAREEIVEVSREYQKIKNSTTLR